MFPAQRSIRRATAQAVRRVPGLHPNPCPTPGVDNRPEPGATSRGALSFERTYVYGYHYHSVNMNTRFSPILGRFWGQEQPHFARNRAIFV